MRLTMKWIRVIKRLLLKGLDFVSHPIDRMINNKGKLQELLYYKSRLRQSINQRVNGSINGINLYPIYKNPSPDHSFGNLAWTLLGTLGVTWGR